MSIQLMTAEEFHSKFSENIKNMLKFMKLKIQTWPTKVKLDCMKRFKLITKILDKMDSEKIRKGLNKI